MATSTNNVKDGFQSEHPFVLIIEQPKKHVLFQCETAPILEEEVVQGIVGYQGNVGILVTCVMKDQKNGKYSSHPHHVINVANVNETGFTCLFKYVKNNEIINFPNLVIKKCKKVNFKDALIMREKMEIDPFKAGFEHKNSPNKIDLNSLRLCFQVFLIDEEETKSLTPVVTNVIYNKSRGFFFILLKTILKINRIYFNEFFCVLESPVIYNFSPTIGSSLGGTQVTLVGDNISKNDKVVMFEVNQNGKRVWEGVSSFRQSDLIKKSAVTFLTPAYERVIQQPVDVYVELRKSDGETSEAWPFTIHPEGLDGSIPLKRAQQTFQEINDSLHFTNICSMPSTSTAFCSETVFMREGQTAQYGGPYQDGTSSHSQMVYQQYHHYGQLYSPMSMNNSNQTRSQLPSFSEASFGKFHGINPPYDGQGATSTRLNQPDFVEDMMAQQPWHSDDSAGAARPPSNNLNGTSTRSDVSSSVDGEYNMPALRPLYIDESAITTQSLSNNGNSTPTRSDFPDQVGEDHGAMALEPMRMDECDAVARSSTNNANCTSTSDQPNELVDERCNLTNLAPMYVDGSGTADNDQSPYNNLNASSTINQPDEIVDEVYQMMAPKPFYMREYNDIA
ncbi:hypothetical protein HCN44_006344 [Aphidius gifuensis]|uniref:RHD domain-containing protein n=1 Tax=Aphidius gifuensis TaxID=684658 RepID=A0A835CQV4_APHGI|nr:hypothetical protein HCN44_006344 [Aphidius gifuensis]